nr:phage tail assembly chaperone [Pseudomonas sp. UBA6718]
MSKFKLDPAPTFKAKVAIPVPGGAAVPVEFEFRHFPKDEYIELFAPDNQLPDVELIEKICVGWELDDPFNKESIEKLRQNYQAAPGAIVRKFAEEIGPARLGN